MLLRRSLLPWRGVRLDLSFWRSLCSSRRGALMRCQRLRHHRRLRMPAISLGMQTLVGPGRYRMLCLNAGRSRMLIACGNQLPAGCGVLNPARTAIIGNTLVVDDRVLLHNRPVVVCVVNGSLIHMHDRGVVGKLVAAPFAA